MRRVVCGVAYSVLPGYRPLELDVHLPEDVTAPLPVVVEVHGGGWLRGSRGEFIPGLTDDETFGRITNAGFAVVAPSYRLSGEAHFPAQLDDLRAALGWVSESGGEHGLDPGRVVLWGSSAGGTIAALVALDSPSPVRGVVDWFGPSDLVAMAEHTRARGAEEPGGSREDRWLGGWVLDRLDLARAASPVHAVRAGAPPFHLAHGANDDDVPPSQTIAFADALASAGVAVDVQLERGAAHLWRGASPDRIAALFDAAILFAQSVVGEH